LCRRRSARTSREPGRVVVDVVQQRVPAVRVVVVAARRFRTARAQVQGVRQRARRPARLSRTSRGPRGEYRPRSSRT